MNYQEFRWINHGAQQLGKQLQRQLTQCIDEKYADRYLGRLQLPLSIGRFHLAAMTERKLVHGPSARLSAQRPGTTPR